MSPRGAQQIQELHSLLTREDPPLSATEKADARNRLLKIIKKALGATRIEHADDYSGFSGALVFLAWATYESGLQKFVVIKIDKPGRIEQEKQNWRKYARHLDRTHSVQLQETNTPGLLIYDTASYFPQHRNLKHREFKGYYASSSNSFVTIQHLFDTVLAPWHSIVTCHEMEDLNAAFRNCLDRRNIEHIKKTVEELIEADLDKPGINLCELVGRDYPLRNPFLVDLFPDQRCSRPYPKCVVHGDLNAKNILIFPMRSLSLEPAKDDRSQQFCPAVTYQLCLVDFYRTGPGNFFADPARLETVIKFQLLEVDEINWKDLLAFEDSLVSGMRNTVPSQGLSAYCPKDSLDKAFWSIQALREKVDQKVSQYPAVSPLSFWLYLYMDTLNSILYKDLSTKQKLYAFLSACMIFDKQLAPEVV